jgi:circadian clock protein KaiC
MASHRAAVAKMPETLPKAPSGIQGFDEVTGGGLPRGRPTLVCGSAGCGKTLFALEFLVRGATRYGEPGVFMAFEETAEELGQNVRSLGYDLDRLVRRKKLAIDFVRVERSEIDETGEYDLEGLFVRLGHAIDSVGARRVVLDTIESLFSGFRNEAVLRAELRRLFRWLKDRGMTAVITAERGEGQLTRQGLEEYVSDCVILLDHRVREQVSTRRLRIVKYRGTTHGTNEYPFLIDEDGVSVVPVTSVALDHPAPTGRVSSGIERLDALLGGRGYFRGSSVLLSGDAGTGKTTIAAHFAGAACRRGERCVYFALEEAPSQVVRNLRSVGLDLEPHVRSGRLRFEAARPTLYGLEMHLSRMHRTVEAFRPKVVVVDPASNLTDAAAAGEAAQLVLRLVDMVKSRGITTLLTSLTHGPWDEERGDMGVSSLADAWLLVRHNELNGVRRRTICVLKARGMAHSSQIQELVLSSSGVEVRDLVLGSQGAGDGSERHAGAAAAATADVLGRGRAFTTAATRRGRRAPLISGGNGARAGARR